MKTLSIVPSYIYWHYGPALRNIWKLAGNFIWFEWHFFSIGILSKSILAPWQRLQEKKARGFDVEGFFETLIVNTIMRLVGAFIRIIFICMGLAVILCTIILAAIIFIIWLLLPLVLVALVAYGLTLLVEAFI